LNQTGKMSAKKHIEPEQLESLLFGDPDEKNVQDLASHVENCDHCQAALDAMAADPKVWDKAPRLISESLIANIPESGTSKIPQPVFPCPEELPEDLSKYSSSVEHLLDPPLHPVMLGRLGSYDIQREVGRGGMGVVFKAFDTELNRPLAIKVLLPHLAENAAARARFASEARAAAAVIHPNVVAIYGVNSNEKTPYLVMPFIAGPSLQHLVENYGPLEEKEIVRIALQVSAGLSAAHSQGLVHRDIKPANILAESDVSRVMVTDFGLARASGDASMTQSGYFVGTPNYMSPEQALGKIIDGRSDLFSLGSVMYFMGTGHMPFRAESPVAVLHRIANDEHTPVQRENADLSKTLSDIVDKLLCKDSEARFQSAGEVHEILEQHLTYLHQPEISKPPRIVVPGRRTALGELIPTKVTGLKWAAVVVMMLLAFSWGKGWFSSPVAAQVPPADPAEPAEKATAWTAKPMEPKKPMAPKKPVKPEKAEVAEETRANFGSNTDVTLPAKFGGLLKVNFEKGEIEVRTGELEKVRVVVEGDKGSAESYPISVETNDGSVSIRPNHNLNAREAEFHKIIVTVPNKYDLDLRTKSGAISVGQIVGQVICETVEGNISLGKVDGPVSVRTANGHIKLGGGSQSVKARAINGNIKLENVDGDVVAETKFGNIRATGLTGSADLVSKAGNLVVSLTKQPKKKCSFYTTAGNIRVNLSKEIAATVTAETLAGKISLSGSRNKPSLKSLLPSGDARTAKLNGGGVQVSAETIAGNISFKSISE